MLKVGKLGLRSLMIVILTIVTLSTVAIFYIVTNRYIPTTSDDSIISQSPCRLPCWQGLNINTSTRVDVDEFITNTDFIPQWTVHENDTIIWWRWARDHRGRFEFDTDQNLIAMQVYPNFEFLAQDVIDIYGSPSAVLARLERSPHENNVLIRLNFYYHSQGLVVDFRFERPPAYEYVIPEDLMGWGFEIHESATTLEEFVSIVHDIEDDVFRDYMQDQLNVGWAGFGSILMVREGEAVFPNSMLIITTTPSQ